MTRSVSSSKKSTTGDRHSRFFDGISKREVDPSSFTVDEIMDRTGRTRAQVKMLVHDNLAMGNWEQVYKRGDTRIQKSYRLKEAK